MLSLAEIAALEERRQAVGYRELAAEVREVAGGVAARGAPGTWVNAAVALGLDGPVDRAELESMASWYEAGGVEARVEVCPFAHPTLLEGLDALGLRIRVFEHTFFRELSRAEPARPIGDPPPGLRIEPADQSSEAIMREHAAFIVRAFMPDGTEPPEAHVALAKKAASHPRVTPYNAYLDGRLAGAAQMEATGRVAGLFGAAVAPWARRRGVQQALLAHRMNEAAARGAILATIGSRPGTHTERNVRRMGFQLAYTRAIVARSGPGLAAVPL